MNGSRLAIGLPLLTKELTEQSARRRTYILRVLYALLLYGFTLWVFWSQLGSWSSNSFAILGKGRELFQALAWLQFAGLYLFLPAMTSGVLTSEKERDTLSLLLLTKLGPWTIVFEKLFSRLVPMASFILLSTPLLAVAYSLGGIDVAEIGLLAWSLAVTALQVGTLALACSAWCRTTAAAFLATYLVGALLIAGPPFVTQGGHQDPTGLFAFIGHVGQQLGLLKGNEEATLLLVGPWLSLHPSSAGMPFGITVLRSLPMLGMAAVCLFVARYALWRRAFLSPSNVLLKIFKSLDGFFHRVNQNRFTKGIVLTHEYVTLPTFDPIRWRETKKRALGTTRYLIRFLLLLEVPVMFGMLIPAYDGASRGYEPANVAAWVLWLVATLVLTIQATGLIGAERSRQTLDVLLTTALTSEEIVQQKFAGVWRMIRTLWIPFATVYVFQIWWQTFVDFDVGNRPRLSPIFGIVRGVLAMAIYPPLIAWLGFHQGMRQRSQTQATLVTLGLIAGVSLIPPIIAQYGWPQPAVIPVWGGPGRAEWTLFQWALAGLTWLSPAYVIASNSPRDGIEWQSYGDSSHWEATAWLGMLGHFIVAAGLLLWLWVSGLRTFARHVNRNDGQIVDDEDIDRLAALRQKIVGGGVFRTATDE